HAELLDLPLGEHLDVELVVLGRERLRGRGEMRRRADVRRAVAEVAGEVHAVRDRDAVGDAASRVGDIGRVADREAEAGEALAVLPVAVPGIALHLVEPVDGASHGLGGEPRRVVRGHVARPLPRDVAHGLADALVLERADGRRERAAELLRVEVGRLAAADEQPLLRGTAARRRHEQRRAELARRGAGTHEPPDQAAGGGVELAGGAGQALVEQRQDRARRALLGRGPGLHGKIHSSLLNTSSGLGRRSDDSGEAVSRRSRRGCGGRKRVSPCYLLLLPASAVPASVLDPSNLPETGTVSIVSRYVFRECLAALTLVLGVVFLILLSNQFPEVLGDAAAGSLPREAVFPILGLTSLSYVTMLAPFALFLGVLLALARLNRDSEM